MLLTERELSRCEQCGAPLEPEVAELGCLNCLLLGGLSVVDAESRRFQHYEICLRADGQSLDELGRGAMGVTYRALDLNLESFVALKIIGPASSENAAARERFRREARNAAQLRHPNVASVFHFGETAAGQCFYAMELVEGETLEALVQRGGPLPVSIAVEVIGQVTRALLAAEAHGLVHRDLKPSNLMVLGGGAALGDRLLVKVIDFGLAKAATAIRSSDTTPATFSGTIGFASPEQLARGNVQLDARSDIYSLGATFHYLLFGKAPSGEFVPAEKQPKPVITLLRLMLAPNPADRPQSAGELLNALQTCRHRLEGKPRRLRQAAAFVAILALITLFGPTNGWWQKHAAIVAPPEKSIAVLPFENLSANEQDSFFALGVQDEILSALAKIADLKVISRTSVAQYKGGTARNLRDIGRTLGVAHVLEGSVQRISDRVRVHAQLIDARTDTHLWVQTYERDFADVFALQSEIASEIANHLRTKLSPAELATFTERPTQDLIAYKLYAEAAALDLWTDWKDLEKAHARQIELLKECISRDPNFVLAQCLLAKVYSHMHGQANFYGQDPRPIDELWKSVVDDALKLRPDLGQPHVGLARYYLFTNDFARAHDEATIACRLLPNDAEARFVVARIDRRQNRWETSLAGAREAYELDPRNGSMISWVCEMYRLMRRYDEGERFVQQAMSRLPELSSWLHLEWTKLKLAKGDLGGAEAILAQVPAGFAPEERFMAALYRRDYDAAAQVVASAKSKGDGDIFGVGTSRALANAQIAHARGELQAAQKVFAEARRHAEAKNNVPTEAWHLSEIAVIDAGLGKKEEAIREARRAVELVPTATDALEGPTFAQQLALVYAWTGERDLAIEQLATLSKIPSPISYGEIRFNPCWDSLRDDPRFDRIVASLKPSSIR